MFQLSGFAGGANAIAFTPTSVKDIDYVELQNGIYNDLMATGNTEFPITDTIPDWDFDTIMHAKFSDSPNAGNVDWNTDTVSDIVVKSRPKDTFQWRTIVTKPIASTEDFDINYIDYLVPSGESTEYALVPVFNGAEGAYEIVEVTPKFEKLFVIEDDIVYGTTLIDGGITVTRNIPSANVELLNNRYPVFVRNTIANYDTGQATGIWLPSEDDENCNPAAALDSEYDYDRTVFQKEFIEILADSKPKIIKDDLGNLWIAQITNPITISPGQSYTDRKIEFSWVEISDTSAKNLYYLGLSDVDEEWW